VQSEVPLPVPRRVAKTGFAPRHWFFGSAIHAALAWYHSQAANGNGVTLEKLCKIFAADWYASG